jgi:type III restriction enzyme
MTTYWVPGVNHNAQYGRWAFVEFSNIWMMDAEFSASVEAGFDALILQSTTNTATAR